MILKRKRAVHRHTYLQMGIPGKLSTMLSRSEEMNCKRVSRKRLVFFPSSSSESHTKLNELRNETSAKL